MQNDAKPHAERYRSHAAATESDRALAYNRCSLPLNGYANCYFITYIKL